MICKNDAKSGSYQASERDRQILSSMKEILSNEYLTLYIGQYYDIAVLDKETGSVFFSNQAIYDTIVGAQR